MARANLQPPVFQFFLGRLDWGFRGGKDNATTGTVPYSHILPLNNFGLYTFHPSIRHPAIDNATNYAPRASVSEHLRGYDCNKARGVAISNTVGDGDAD